MLEKFEHEFLEEPTITTQVDLRSIRIRVRARMRRWVGGDKSLARPYNRGVNIVLPIEKIFTIPDGYEALTVWPLGDDTEEQ